MTTIELEKKVLHLESEVANLKQACLPWHQQELIKELQNNIGKQCEELVSTRIELKKAQEIMSDIVKSRVVEDITNEEIQNAMIESGKSIKQIAAHFNVEFQTASNWINGKHGGNSKRKMVLDYLKVK